MRTARIVGVVLAGLLGVAGALISVLVARTPGTPVNELAILLVITAYATVAVIVSLARPGHPVERLMLAGSCIWGLGEGFIALAVRALANDQTTYAGWFGVVGTTARGLGWLILILGLPLIFPTVGRRGAGVGRCFSRSRPSAFSVWVQSWCRNRLTTGWTH